MLKQLQFSFLLYICFSCQVPSSNKNEKTIENFENFTINFYSDSLFQISRIMFPLPFQSEIVVDANTKTMKKITFPYDRKDWNRLKNAPNKISDTKWTYTTKDSLDTKIETLALNNSGQKITMKFRIIKNKWFLVYYEVWDF